MGVKANQPASRRWCVGVALEVCRLSPREPSAKLRGRFTGGGQRMAERTDESIIAAGVDVLEDGASCLRAAASGLGHDFAECARSLSRRDSFTLVLGVGKSGTIGKKFAASLLSTGHGAAFVHPTDALHGDLGIAEHGSLAILLSHSGNTEELLAVVPALKQFGVAAAGVTRSRDCALAPYMDWIIETRVGGEAGVGRLAPTSSTTTTLAVCDALLMASLSLRGFSAEQFHRYHPGGNLGWKLRTVGDLMIPLAETTWLAPSATIYEVLEQISLGGRGFGVVGDRAADGRVKTASVGLIADGDIRRAASDRTQFAEQTAATIMTPSPKAISRDALAMEALRLMETHAITSLLCSDSDGYLVGSIHIHDILAREVGFSPKTRRGSKTT